MPSPSALAASARAALALTSLAIAFLALAFVAPALPAPAQQSPWFGFAPFEHKRTPKKTVRTPVPVASPFAFFAPFAAPAPHAPAQGARAHSFGTLDGSIARHAAANGVPLALAQRVVKRESGGNPRAVSKGNYGLMQIRLGTARAMGYRGDAAGLLDPDVNMTYAMRYLAGAYRAAGGNHDRAVALYARGYYYEAKRMGFSPYSAPSAAPL